MRPPFLAHGHATVVIDRETADVAHTDRSQERAMPPLRRPLDAEPYTSELLFKGTRVKDAEEAKLYAERLARAKARMNARNPEHA